LQARACNSPAASFPRSAGNFSLILSKAHPESHSHPRPASASRPPPLPSSAGPQLPHVAGRSIRPGLHPCSSSPPVSFLRWPLPTLLRRCASSVAVLRPSGGTLCASTDGPQSGDVTSIAVSFNPPRRLDHKVCPRSCLAALVLFIGDLGPRVMVNRKHTVLPAPPWPPAPSLSSPPPTTPPLSAPPFAAPSLSAPPPTAPSLSAPPSTAPSLSAPPATPAPLSVPPSPPPSFSAHHALK